MSSVVLHVATCRTCKKEELYDPVDFTPLHWILGICLDGDEDSEGVLGGLVMFCKRICSNAYKETK